MSHDNVCLQISNDFQGVVSRKCIHSNGINPVHIGKYMDTSLYIILFYDYTQVSLYEKSLCPYNVPLNRELCSDGANKLLI